MTMIPYGRQSVSEADIRAVAKVLRSDFLTQGPAVGRFEEKLAAHCGARHAVVFSSGTAALHAAYHAAGLSAGDGFVTTPLTFAATANAGLYLGARPVFSDVEPDTGNLDPARLEEALTERTRLVVPVHYAGHPVDMEAVARIARKWKLTVVEDACHALGSEYGGARTGACRFSAMTVFSFHPVKHITSGEGGAVLTNDRKLSGRLRLFRSHGIVKEPSFEEKHGGWYYEMRELGYNYRMTDIQAALGASQLDRLDVFVEKRRKIVAAYGRAFAGTPYFDLPAERPGVRSSWHLYPVRLKDRYRRHRRTAFARLREKGLGVQVHYIPVHLQPYYRRLGFRKGAFPAAEDFYAREISLPLYPAMSRKDVARVVSVVNDVFAGL